MIKLGVFYSPENDLRNNIEFIKTYFGSKSKINKYLDHLVHSSLYVFNTELIEINEIIKEFENLQITLIPITSKITKWIVFGDDILTGLNTLCLEVELTNELKNLQYNIVNTLFKFHSNEFQNSFEGDLKISNDKYGYPFVGEHWIPHFTIGSMEIETKKILEHSDGLFQFPKDIVINNLSLYKIEGDSHSLIKKIRF